MNNNNNLIDDILKAIDIMATKKISSAGYDKTIQGTIISCQDRTIGKYKIKYQDGYWYAYSTSGDVYYSNGTSVYILIPNGDMRKEKTILGAVQKLGTNYLNILEQEQKYNFIGNNIIANNNAIFSLSSYKENGDTIVLYNKNNSSSENLIQINQQQMIQYLKQSPSFIIGADIQTQLNIEQQYQGNYGILVGLNFLDNATKTEVTRYYMVDVDMMTGNPYRFINGVHQSGIFEIDNQNFLNIDSISLFTKDFPNEDNSKPKDIFISNLEIKGAVKLSQTELDSYALLLNTPKGYIFNDQSLDTDTRRIEAEVRIKGKTVNLKAQSLPFYWFVQNNTITAKSEKYNRYGGQGWECLNQYNTLNNKTLQYIPMSNVLQVKKANILIEKVKYKCVTVYDNTILSKEITIINKDAEYRIFVESDQGTVFKYDVGSPTLTCHCQRKNVQNDFEDVDINNYKFIWSCINNVGNFESLTNSSEYIINENKIINLNIKNITRFTTYKCAVFTKQNHGDNFLGTASITLSNLLQSSGFYTLIINNGSQVFKYNTFGVSPASKQNAIPLEIPTLNFTVFDDIGNPVSDDIIKYSDITWTVPIENTLLKIDDSYQGNIDSTLSKKLYKNLMSLTYDIAELYDPNKINNTIQLKVNYNGMTLVANTNLTFTKEGNSGTNGTDFVCKIVPNVIQGGSIPTYPTLYIKTRYKEEEILPPSEELPTDEDNTPSEEDSTSIKESYNTIFEFNWNTDLETNHWFKAELWHNGNEPIFSGYQNGESTEGKEIFIKGWEILKNQYNSKVYDDSNINVDYLTGKFSINTQAWWLDEWNYSDYVNNWIPANIIKVTLQYDGLTYYATLPLIMVKIFNSNYKLNLKPNTGFREVIYTNAGIQPSYNNRIPFELILQHKINSYWENVTDSSQISYKWYYFGSIKERGSIANEPAIIQQELTNDDGSSTNFWLMPDKRLEKLKSYQKRIKPVDQYDGECKNIGLGCRVYYGSTTLAWIHIPIHMLRNRFENAAINGWDGNSVDLGDDNGGTILAPQIGAGYKDSNNRFTGIVIGKSKNGESIGSEKKQDINGTTFAEVNEDIGLFGFNAGARSIFLDAKTGKAVFGEKNKAQIILDPSNDTAEIKSGNYTPKTSLSSGSGMMIDLSTPQIKYGTGNFEVNNEGYLIAKGGGKIANWDISDYKLTSGTTGLSSQQDPAEPGAEKVTYNSPFENLIPSLMNWKDKSIKIGDLVNKQWTDVTDYLGQTEQDLPTNFSIKDLGSEHYEIDFGKQSINYRVHTIVNTLRNNKEGIIFYSSNNNVSNYKARLLILAYGDQITQPDEEEPLDWPVFSLKIYLSENFNLTTPGVLKEFSKDILDQWGNYDSEKGLEYSIYIFVESQKLDNNNKHIPISATDSQVATICNRLKVFSSSHLSLISTNKTKAFWTKNSKTGEQSYLTHDGILVANTAILGNGSNKIYIGKKESFGSQSISTSALFSYKKASKNANSSGFYLGTDGLGLGKTYTDDNGNDISNFQVDADGSFYARSGYIGNKSQGWTVKYNKMYNGAENFGDSGFFLSPTRGISLVAKGSTSDQLVPSEVVQNELIEWPDYNMQPSTDQKVLFSVDGNGVMTSKKAYIANWYMTNNQMRTRLGNTNKYPGLGSASFDQNAGTITIRAGNLTGRNLTNVAITNKGIRIGSSFYVSVKQGDDTGKVYCTNAYLSGTIYGTAGKIGGWTIGDGKISSSKIELNANNNVIAVGYGGKITVGTNMTLDGTNGSIKLGGGSYNTTFSSDGCYISANGFAGFNTAYIEDLRIYAPRISGNLYHLGMDSDRVVIALDGSSIRFKDIDREYNPFQYSNFYNLKTYKAKYKKGFLVQGDIWQDKYLPMFVAEDVAELQPLAAKYDNNGQVQDWNYRVIIPIQHLLIRDLNNRVSTLQKQIEELKQLINK